MKLVILRRKFKKVRQHPQEQQQQTSFKDLLEYSRSKIQLLKGRPVGISVKKRPFKMFMVHWGQNSLAINLSFVNFPQFLIPLP